MFVSPIESQVSPSADDWTERSKYWLANIQAHTPKRKRRERQATPLILAGQGISLRVEKATLLISDGHTHFPDEERVYRFFKGDLKLPTRIVLVDGSGQITLDALDWLADQRVTLVRLRWDGRLACTLGADAGAVDYKKLTWQREAQSDEKARLAFAVPLIRSKARATLSNLRTVLPPSHSRNKAIDTAKTAISELGKAPPQSIGELLAVEGRIAAGYFFAWRALQIQWKAKGKYPIHDDWRRYFSRASLNAGIKKKNRDATHPVNAMLNYAYRLLEAHVRIGAIAQGYDPTCGLLHKRTDREVQSFVYDLMEPLRPVVDRAVLELVMNETFTGADFIRQTDGVCRLSPDLARMVVHRVQQRLQKST